MDSIKPIVLIMMGSDSDYDIMQETGNVLESFGVAYKMLITSAHKTPIETVEYIRKYEDEGVEVFICGAGMAAHLAGVTASYTLMPVIGVPLNSTSSTLGGIDALLSTLQMPGGIPVATMAIGKAGAKNAAIFAVQILAKKYPYLQSRLQEYRDGLRNDLAGKGKRLQ
ncbi:5-(carboxyamino)imidazole ribonucleotide mutase [bacterium]|nr:5-(carboxyamino)imidazole ribonucleotide mutase [bacterium]MBU1754407.1 5-(carboxyamino)imidazole ribonucleotide mutase [bacterium]